MYDPLAIRSPGARLPHFAAAPKVEAEDVQLGSRIVAHLAQHYAPLVEQLEESNRLVAIYCQPPIHAFFHHFALWALGVGVLFLDQNLDACLRHDLIAPAQAILYCTHVQSPKDAQWVEALQVKHKWQLHPQQHGALAMAQWAQQQQQQESIDVPEWPRTIKMPHPALVNHTSASTGVPKHCFTAIHFWSRGLKRTAMAFLGAQADTLPTQLHQRGRLLTTNCFFFTYTAYITLQWIVGQPVIVPHPADGKTCTPTEWLETIALSDAAHFGTYPTVAEEMVRIARGNARYQAALRKLDSLAVMGAPVEPHLDALFRDFGIKQVHNIYGVSEFGRVMSSKSPPMRLDALAAGPGSNHLVFTPLPPSSDNDKQTTETEYQAWSIIERNPKLQANIQQGGIHVKVEPFAGPGADHGKPCINLADLFVRLPDAPGQTEPFWKLVGRSSDVIVYANTLSANASALEAKLAKCLRDRSPRDTVTAVQVLGHGKPWSACLIQSPRPELLGQGRWKEST
ncbi:AMP-dependent synthetase/ligase [Ceraceosorus bombacis]|uniref:AMP-dependent synthetase/ligase n=1 Tax=Ceraceosorus bombacis TaxID=401625 RepID=A0A0P1BB52_9BASI|nr:AMP-dependent synthetase/ligase [Ceraceosorus bombacis]